MQMDGPLVARNDLGLGMVHGARLQADGFAEGHDFVTFCKILFHVRRVPPAAMKACSAVIEHDLENGFFALTKPFDAHRDDLAASDDRFAET